MEEQLRDDRGATDKKPDLGHSVAVVDLAPNLSRKHDGKNQEIAGRVGRRHNQTIAVTAIQSAEPRLIASPICNDMGW